MGTGEVTRYIGKYGTDRVRKAVLIGTLGPYLVKASDNDHALIHMTFTGVRDDANHYFRTLPRFETAAPKYAFLNRLLAVGIGEGHRDGPVHTIEEIL